MTREGEAAYRALKRNIGAEYLERAARLCEERAAFLRRMHGGTSSLGVTAGGEVYGDAAWEVAYMAERIREMKEDGGEPHD